MAQYYNFLRLGFGGYRRVQGTPATWPRTSPTEVEKLGPFELVTRGDELPVFAFKVRRRRHAISPSSTCRTRSESAAGWSRPTRSRRTATDLAVLRVVVKRGFSHDVADLFIADLRRQLPRLERQPEPVVDPATGAGFRH